MHFRGLVITATVCTVADSYVAATAREAVAAAERAAELKISKYTGLWDKCVFQPIAVESLGPLNETACQFLKDLGRRISAQSGARRKSPELLCVPELLNKIQGFTSFPEHGVNRLPVYYV